MIYTCTSNPSLDYYVTVENINSGEINRSSHEMYEAGGKGVNVSIVLNNLNIPSVTLGFLGGFTKDYYLSHISKYPFIQPLFTTISGNTRINIKVMTGDHETGINAKGPHITEEEFFKFSKRLQNIYEGDYFVLSGNIEEDIKEKVIRVIHELAAEKVRIVLDTDPDVTEKCLDIKPYLVKISSNNLSYWNMSIEEALNHIIEKGAVNAMYSNVEESSYLYTSDKKYQCDTLPGSLVNTTGSSDSMVAGFLYASLRGGDSKERFIYANAASIATTMSNDLASKEKVEEVFGRIQVNEI